MHTLWLLRPNCWLKSCHFACENTPNLILSGLRSYTTNYSDLLRFLRLLAGRQLTFFQALTEQAFSPRTKHGDGPCRHLMTKQRICCPKNATEIYRKKTNHTAINTVSCSIWLKKFKKSHCYYVDRYQDGNMIYN